MTMSSADLLEDGFPHGTPEGYEQGCRGSACPAGAEYGLSCKTARLKSRSDYQYQRLAKTGATPAQIADALGLVGTSPTATPVKPATAVKKPKPTPDPAPHTPEPAGETLGTEVQSKTVLICDLARSKRNG
jgi:hypothetical protein